MISIKLNNFEISNKHPFILISGPCVLESKDHAIKIAEKINTICKDLNVNFIFKSSFDKANRTSFNSSRGVGLEKALKYLKKLRNNLHVPY